jgi:hypothetical protein
MARPFIIAFFVLLGWSSTAQTFFYINQIQVTPNPATTEDEVQVQLIGFLSSTGAYVASAQASITGNLVTLTVVAADNGGLTVLVPHTETIQLGQLPPGDYSVAFALNSSGILVTAPPGQGDFTVLGDGGACDALTIASVQWHAFSDTAIVVHVQNSGPAGFDYPGFILFDANGDTLAKETVNYFAIAGDSWHVLRVADEALIAQGSFEGRLELWTGFFGALACTWPGSFNLCPPPPCANVFPTVMNIGGALIAANYTWQIHDGASLVASGQFELSGAQQMDSDTICLPPGDYTLEVSATGPPVGGNPVYAMLAEGGQSTMTHPVVWSLPVGLEVSLYAPCSGFNGMHDASATGWRINAEPHAIQVRRLDGAPIGQVRLLDATGRLLFTATSTSNEAYLPTRTTGLHVVTAGGKAWKLLR